jgi:hypothetical protein
MSWVVVPGAKVRAAARPGVIAACGGGAVGGVEGDDGRQRGRAGQRNGEDGVGGSAVALDHRDVVDGQRRKVVVVDDRAEALPVGERRVDRVGEVHLERFGHLEHRVARDGYRDLLGGTPAAKVNVPVWAV